MEGFEDRPADESRPSGRDIGDGFFARKRRPKKI
jgi:hypothetical protein